MLHVSLRILQRSRTCDCMPGMVYHDAQLNFPVQNMLDESWDLFVQTLGSHVKLSDVVSGELSL